METNFRSLSKIFQNVLTNKAGGEGSSELNDM